MKKILALLMLGVLAPVGYACDYYASPEGSGDRTGLSPEHSFLIFDFWAKAAPGKTLCLMDGLYQGPKSMIKPPVGLSGKRGAPITIKAINEGNVRISGIRKGRPVIGRGRKKPVDPPSVVKPADVKAAYADYKNVPIHFQGNDWFVVEGMNVSESAGTVVFVYCKKDPVKGCLDGSDNNIFRRIMAWDAKDGNNKIYQITGNSRNNVLEDVAGWGTARKTFSFYKSYNNTFRRAWGRWERSVVIGPKLTYTISYNARDNSCENCLGTWSQEKMPKAYDVLTYKLDIDRSRNPKGGLKNNKVAQGYSIFGMDRIDGDDQRSGIRILGSIAYLTKEQSFYSPKRMNYFTKMGDIRLENVINFIPPGPKFSEFESGNFFPNVKGQADELYLKNVSLIGGKPPVQGGYPAYYKDYFPYHPRWKAENVYVGTQRPDNVYTGEKGARVCYRYINGKETREPLWPWPMNDRIKQALRDSGRKEVDVTKTIESLLGPIPAECRSDGSGQKRKAAQRKAEPPASDESAKSDETTPEEELKKSILDIIFGIFK